MTKLILLKSEKNLRIISKQYAHLQTMTLTSIKFHSNRHKTVGGVSYTRSLLLEGAQKDGRTDRRTECQILCSLAFLRKGGGRKVRQLRRIKDDTLK